MSIFRFKSKLSLNIFFIELAPCRQIAAGGVYYMISRALGPALGGSIGLMFFLANSISVATYTIGFSESLLDFLQVYSYSDCLDLKQTLSGLADAAG